MSIAEFLYFLPSQSWEKEIFCQERIFYRADDATFPSEP